MNKRKVFVIGDSISIHYGPFLKNLLENDSEYDFEYDRKRGMEQALKDLDKPVGANGGDSNQVLEYLLEEKAKGIMYDLLLINCGLHDIRTDVKNGLRQVDSDIYEENLNKICEISLGMAKKVIWVESTPVYDEIHNNLSKEMHRYKSDLEKYNQIAVKVMEVNSIS
ncbi:MAG: SGNH/GDSL hydrolase family protein, partial [Clostridiales bacterium]|nr:SGNH/GDSL hydrolase family protein [Clostridiales bacterium]